MPAPKVVDADQLRREGMCLVKQLQEQYAHLGRAVRPALSLVYRARLRPSRRSTSSTTTTDTAISNADSAATCGSVRYSM